MNLHKQDNKPYPSLKAAQIKYYTITHNLPEDHSYVNSIKKYSHYPGNKKKKKMFLKRLYNVVFWFWKRFGFWFLSVFFVEISKTYF